jgi:hypothetical protein
MLLLKQCITIDFQQYVPALVRAATTTVLFIVVFILIYRLWRTCLTNTT